MTGKRYGGPLVRAVTAAIAAASQRRKSRSYTLKKKPTGTYRKRKTARRTRSGSAVTMSKRRTTVRQNHSTENRSIALRVPARAPTALALARACLEPQWYRVQGLSQYDTSVGFYPLANRFDTTNARHLCPAHVWDLTSLINMNSTGTGSTNVDAGFGLGFNGTAANSPNSVFNLGSQDATGAYRVYPNTQWIAENATGGYDDLAKRKCIHNWSHIKMNLYGVRKRATKFVVQLVMVKNQNSDFIGTPTTLSRKLVDALVRPFIFNNLNSGDPQTLRSELKVLKTYEVTVAPTLTDEYGGTSATPHIQTLNWFIEHNRVRRYDWLRQSTPSNDQSAAFDNIGVASDNARVHPMKRVYLLVRALSPDRRSDSAANWAPAGYMEMAAADPISEPSYDLVIRNKFSTPT